MKKFLFASAALSLIASVALADGFTFPPGGAGGGGSVTSVICNSGLTGGTITTTGTCALDQSFTPTWTGTHTFSNPAIHSNYVEYQGVANPSTPSANNFRLFADTSGRLSWIGSNGFIRTFDGLGITANRAYVLPDQAGTLTVLGNSVSGSGSIVLTTSPTLTGTPSAASVAISGTGGLGFVEYQPQSSAPSTPAANTFRMFADTSGRLNWKAANGFVRTFDATANTADRTYTLPDAGGFVTVLGNSVSGSGNFCLVTSCSLVTPNLGTPASGTLTNATGLPISTGVSGLGAGVTLLLSGASSGGGGPAGTIGPSFVAPFLGTVGSGILTNATGLPVSTGISGLGSGVATLLGGASSGTGGPLGSTNPSLGLTQILTAANGLTAHAGGGGVGSCLVLTSAINNFSIVGTAGDSTCLPAATAGELVFVGNSSTNKYLTVFPASGEQINSLGSNVSVNLAGVTGAVFSSSGTGKWQSYLPVVGTANDAVKLDSNGFLSDSGYIFSGTAAQTYTLPSTTATIARTDAAQTFVGTETFSGVVKISSSLNVNTKLTVSANSPTVSGTGLGTSPVISSAGSMSGVITTGSSPANANFTITFSAASTGWACFINDLTSNSSNIIGETSTTTTTAVFQAYSRTTGLAQALTGSDSLNFSCAAY